MTSVMHFNSSQCRQSSGYGGRTFGHDILKDTRPLSSKPFMQREIRDLVEVKTKNVNKKVFIIIASITRCKVGKPTQSGRD